MAGSLTLRVITPDRIALDTQVRSVRVPGADGGLGILPRHAAMVAALDPGLLRYRTEDGKERVLFISGGFAEVRGDTLRVVTEAGEKPEEIDEARAQEAEKRARARLAGTHPGSTEEQLDQARADAALRRAIWRLRAREHASP
jgi:F-type H+-transporting ATPase subunit epsilon